NLRAIDPAVDVEHAVACEPIGGKPREPLLHGLRERGPPDVEAKLDGGRDLVHVLSARTRRPDESLLDLPVPDDNFVGNRNHRAPSYVLRAFEMNRLTNAKTAGKPSSARLSWRHNHIASARGRALAMTIVERVKNICLTPNTEWPVIAGENTSA